MYTIPQNPLGLIAYAFRALATTKMSVQQLVFFISFDLRKLPPSQMRKQIHALHEKGQLEIEDDMVLQPSKVDLEPESSPPISSKDLGQQLRLFVSSSRLSRAVGMDDQAIEFQRLSKVPLKIKATVHGSRKYMLELDEQARKIVHDCPDWKRVSVLHRLCKHVAKLILLLEKDEALRILNSLQEAPWAFIQS
ncbi:MAG: DUF2240 family protein [Candidatus Thorarchaeota archaeon]